MKTPHISNNLSNAYFDVLNTVSEVRQLAKEQNKTVETVFCEKFQCERGSPIYEMIMAIYRHVNCANVKI